MKKKLPERLKPLVNGKSAMENYKDHVEKRQKKCQEQRQEKEVKAQIPDEKVVAEMLRKEIEKCLK